MPGACFPGKECAAMGLKTVSRSFPVNMERDVIVCGGGTAGTVTVRAVDTEKLRTLRKEQGAIL
jgi:hypothetical protein